MYGDFSYEEIENGALKGSVVYVDVRGPLEFSEATIPGAVNIPVMDDDERKLVGTMFKQDVKRAKIMGIEATSRRLPEIYAQIEKLYEEYDNVVIFCARGGYRSRSIFYLMRSMSFHVYRLKGGYKDYRSHVNRRLPELVDKAKFIVLTGKTGCGKTKILKVLENMGKNVLDLEGYANHRGSLLGSINLGKQYSQKMFESFIYHALVGKEGELFFVEGESKRIGRIVMHNYLYDKIRSSETILVEAPMDYRVENIYEDYVDNNEDEIVNSLDYLGGYMSKSKIEELKDMIHDGDYRKVIEILMIDYYDIKYRINDDVVSKIINCDEYESANKLIETYNV